MKKTKLFIQHSFLTRLTLNARPSAVAFSIFFFTTFCIVRSPGQNAPIIDWQKSYGGTKIDDAYSIHQTVDEGFIIGGYSQSHDSDVTNNLGSYDYWILKLNSSGDTIWKKNLGGFKHDYAYSIRQTFEGGYVVAGATNSIDGNVSGHHGTSHNYDDWIVKLDASGNIVWQKCLGGSGDDGAYFIQQISDAGYVVAGYSYSNNENVSGHNGDSLHKDFWIVRLDTAGNIKWQKSLGGSDDDVAYSIQQTLDGGFITAGYSFSNDSDVTGNHGLQDYWIVKLDSSGNISWQKSLGGSGDDEAYSIEQIADGGFIVAGFSNSNDGDVSGNHLDSAGNTNYDYWIVKLNSLGNIVWQKSLGGTGDDEPYSIQQTTDHEFLVAGSSNSDDGDVTGNHGGDDYWIVKLDTAGNINWQKSLGGSSDDVAYSIQQTLYGSFIVAGASSSTTEDVSGNNGGDDYWIVKLCSLPQTFYADADSDGYGNANVTITDSVCSAPAGYASDSTDCDDTNPGIHPGAQEIPGNGIDDNCNGVTDEFNVGIHNIETASSFIILPNPATNLVTLQLNSGTRYAPANRDDSQYKITIVTVLGQTVFEKTSHPINEILHEEIPLDKKFQEGLYFVKVSNVHQQWVKPLVVTK